MNVTPPRRFAQTLPAVAGSVGLARRAVTRFLEESSTPNPPLNDIALVVSEAVTNVVLHAYRDRDPGAIDVRVELTINEVELVVQDQGGGMVPRPDSPGLGLGLPLIASVSDRFDARSTPDGGTRLSVWFSITPGSSVG